MRGLSNGRRRLLGTFWAQLLSPFQFRLYFSLQSQPGFLPPPLLKTPASLDFSGAQEAVLRDRTPSQLWPVVSLPPSVYYSRLSGVFPQVSLSVTSRCWLGAESPPPREHPLLSILLPGKVLFTKHSR